MDVHVLAKALERLLLRMKERPEQEESRPLDNITPIIKKPIVPVSEKIVFVLRLMHRRGTAHFDELFENAKSRSEIIAIFYASLELLKAGRLTMRKALGDATNSNIVLEFNKQHKRDEPEAQ